MPSVHVVSPDRRVIERKAAGGDFIVDVIRFGDSEGIAADARDDGHMDVLEDHDRAEHWLLSIDRPVPCESDRLVVAGELFGIDNAARGIIPNWRRDVLGGDVSALPYQGDLEVQLIRVR